FERTAAAGPGTNAPPAGASGTETPEATAVDEEALLGGAGATAKPTEPGQPADTTPPPSAATAPPIEIERPPVAPPPVVRRPPPRRAAHVDGEDDDDDEHVAV